MIQWNTFWKSIFHLSKNGCPNEQNFQKELRSCFLSKLKILFSNHALSKERERRKRRKKRKNNSLSFLFVCEWVLYIPMQIFKILFWQSLPQLFWLSLLDVSIRLFVPSFFSFSLVQKMTTRRNDGIVLDLWL